MGGRGGQEWGVANIEKLETPKPGYAGTVVCAHSAGSAYWLDIATLDRSKMDFVLVAEDGAVRLHLWNPYRSCWERAYPIGSIVRDGEDCYNPTHWMPCPDAPNDKLCDAENP